jgi:hypothetical protein
MDNPLDQPFIDWPDIEAKPAYAELPHSEKIAAFKMFTDYSSAYAKRQLEKTSDPQEQANLAELHKQQSDWEAKKAQELLRLHTPVGLLDGLDDSGSIIDAVRNVPELLQKGYSQESINAVRRKVEDTYLEPLRQSMSGDTNHYSDFYGGRKDFSDDELRKMMWETPNAGDRMRSTERLVSGRSINVVLSALEGLAQGDALVHSATMSAEAEAWNKAHGFMTKDELLGYADSLSRTQKKIADATPLDPREGGKTAAFVEGIAQAPGQLVTSFSTPVNAVANLGQMLSQDSSAMLAVTLKSMFDEKVATKQLPAETSFDQWKSSIPKDEMTALQTTAIFKALPSAGVNTVLETLADRFLTKALPIHKIPVVGKTLDTMIRKYRKLAPRVAQGTQIGLEMLAKGNIEGGEEILQGVSSAAGRKLFGGSKEGLLDEAQKNWLGGLGGSTMGAPSTVAGAIKNHTDFMDGNAVLDGSDKLVVAMKARLEHLKNTVGEDHPTYRAAEDSLRAVEDQAHLQLYRLGEGNADPKRAKAFQARLDAQTGYYNSLKKWAQGNGTAAEFDAPERIRADGEAVAAAQETYAKKQTDPEAREAYFALAESSRKKAEGLAKEAEAAKKNLLAEFDDTDEAKAFRARAILSGIEGISGLPDVELARVKDAVDAGEKFQNLDDVQKFLAGPEAPALEMTPPLERQAEPTSSVDLNAALNTALEAAIPFHQSNKSQNQSAGDAWFEGARVNEAARNGFTDALNQGGDTIQAHGMGKEATLSGGIRNLVGLLKNGLDMSRRGGRLDTAPLVTKPGEGLIGATASGSAYNDGPFILLARPGQALSGDLSGLGAVLVNEANADILPQIRAALQAARPGLIVESYANAGKVTQTLLNPEQKGGETPWQNPSLSKPEVKNPEVKKDAAASADAPLIPAVAGEQSPAAVQLELELSTNLSTMEETRAKLAETGVDTAQTDADIEAAKSYAATMESMTPAERIKARSSVQALNQNREALVRLQGAVAAVGGNTAAIDERLLQFDKVMAMMDPERDAFNELNTPSAPDAEANVFSDVAPAVTPESKDRLTKWAEDRIKEGNTKAIAGLLKKNEDIAADPASDRVAIIKAEAYVAILKDAEVKATAAAKIEADRRVAAAAEIAAERAKNKPDTSVAPEIDRARDTATAFAKEMADKYGGDPAVMADDITKLISAYVAEIEKSNLPPERKNDEIELAYMWESTGPRGQGSRGPTTLLGELRKNAEGRKGTKAKKATKTKPAVEATEASPGSKNPLKVWDAESKTFVDWHMGTITGGEEGGYLSNRTKLKVGDKLIPKSANEPNPETGVEPVDNAPAPEPESETSAAKVAKEVGESTKIAIANTLQHQKFAGTFQRENPSATPEQIAEALHTAFVVAMNEDRFSKGMGDGIASKAFLEAAAGTAEAQTDPLVRDAVKFLAKNVRSLRRTFIENAAAESTGLHTRLTELLGPGVNLSEATLYEGREFTMMDAFLMTKGTAEVRDIARTALDKGVVTKELGDALYAAAHDPQVIEQLKKVADEYGITLSQANLKDIYSLDAQDLATMEADPLFPEAFKILHDAHKQLMGDNPLLAAAKDPDVNVRNLAKDIIDRITPETLRDFSTIHNWALLPGMSQGLHVRWQGSTVHVAPRLAGTGIWTRTALHEVLHPLLNEKYRLFESGNLDALTKGEIEACEGIKGLIEIVQAEALKRLDSITDLQERSDLKRDLFGSVTGTSIRMSEFLNEAINHKPFADFLKSIEAPGETGVSVYKKLVNWFVTLLTGKPAGLTSAHQKAMEHLLDLVGNKDRVVSIEKTEGDRNALQMEFIKKTLGEDPAKWTDRDFNTLAQQFAILSPSGTPTSASSQQEALRIANSLTSGLTPGEKAAVLHSEKAHSPGEVTQYLREKYSDMIRALGTDLDENYMGHTARYVVSSRDGGGFIQFNPSRFSEYSKAQIDAIMREELIHAASGEVLKKMFPGQSLEKSWVGTFTEIGNSLTKAERASLKGVYKSASAPHEIGAEFFRAGVQKVLYGTITEAELNTTAMQKVVALVKSAIDFFRAKGETDPRFKELFEETIKMMRAADPKSVVAANYPEVSQSMSVGPQKVIGETFLKAFSKANPENPTEKFVDPKNPAEAERLLTRFVNDPTPINAGGSKAADGAKRTVAMNFPDEGTAKFLGITDGLKARVAHALTEEFDRKTFNDDKVRTASVIPQTIREADLVGTRDFKYRGRDVDVITYAKLYNDPESPTGVRWHIVEAISPKGKGAGYFDTQFSSIETDLGRALAARVIDSGRVVKRKALPEAVPAQEPAAEAGTQGGMPDVSSKQSPDEIAPATLSDITKTKTVQDIIDQITDLEAKQKRMEASGDYIGAAKVAAQIAALDAEWNTMPPEISQSAPAGINLEVAPNPSNEEAMKKWETLDQPQREQVTRAVGPKVLGDLAKHMGMPEPTVEHTAGGFMGLTNPAMIVSFPEGTSFDQMARFGKLAGVTLRQDSVIPFDEGDTTNGDQGYFVKLNTDRPLTLAEKTQFFKEINALLPEAARGFTGTDEALVFGNFTQFDDAVPSLDNKEFWSQIEQAATKVVQDKDYKIEPVEKTFRSEYTSTSDREAVLKETNYGTDATTTEGEAGGDVLRQGQGGFDTLQSNADALLASEIRNATGTGSSGAIGSTYSADTEPVVSQSEAVMTPHPELQIDVRRPKKTEGSFVAGRDMVGLSFDEVKSRPKVIKRMVDKMLAHGIFRVDGRAKSPTAQAEYMVKQMVSNLTYIYDRVPEAIRERSKGWYKGANRIANRWSGKYDVPVQGVAGAIAALSPQRDWNMNVSLGERLLDIVTGKGRKTDVMTPEMVATADKIDNSPGNQKKDREIEGIIYPYQEFRGAAERIQKAGTAFDQMTTGEKAFFVRLYDETYNPPTFTVVTPEGGFERWKTTAGGQGAIITWGPIQTIEKALRIIEDPSAENISKQLGGQHKVRSFYNNIINPLSDSVVTIDTHAVAAAYMLPLSGSSKEVTDNFGSQTKEGFSGTYGLIAEAYRRAAAEKGVSPSEMQSITWEAIREVYTGGYKRAAGKWTGDDTAPTTARDVWDLYAKRKITFEEAQKQAFEVGGGYTLPQWFQEPELIGVGTGGSTFKSATPGEKVLRTRDWGGLKNRLNAVEAKPVDPNAPVQFDFFGSDSLNEKALKTVSPREDEVVRALTGEAPEVSESAPIPVTMEDIYKIPMNSMRWFENREPLIWEAKNKAERSYRLLQLREGTLHFRIEGKSVEYGGDPAEKALYKEFREHLASPEVSQSEPANAERLAEASRIAQDEEYDNMGDKVPERLSGLFGPRGVPMTFTPSRFDASSRRTSEAMGRIQSLPEYAAIKRVLEGRTIIRSSEDEMVSQAHAFLAAHDNDLHTAFEAAENTPGVSNDQAAVIQGLALKKSADIARAAREAAVAAPTAQRRADLLTIAEHNENLNSRFANKFLERSSLWGQEGRSLRMVADLFGPANWAEAFTRPIQKAQAKKLAKEKLPKEILDRLSYAAELAATSTTTAMQRALDKAANRMVPKDATPEEIQAQQDLHRALSSPLRVREEIVKSAVEMAVTNGMATVEKAMSAEEKNSAEGVSFLNAWRGRLVAEATDQLNAAIAARLQGGKVDAAPAPALTPEQQKAADDAKLNDIWANLGDIFNAEIVFRLARSSFAVAQANQTVTNADGTTTTKLVDNPYAHLVHKVEFDLEKSKGIKRAVLASVNMGQEIRKSITDRNITKDRLSDLLRTANPELTEAQAGLIASAAEAIYNDEVQKASAKELAKLAKVPANREKLDNDTMGKLLGLVNMGAFSNEAAYNVLAPKYNLPAYDKAAVEALEKEAIALQQFPEGSPQRNEAGQRLAQSILKANVAAGGTRGRIRHYANVASALWVAGVLSRPQTQFVNATATTASVFMEAAAEARGYQMAALAAGATPEQASEFYKDIARAFVFSFGKDASNTSVRALMEAERAITAGTTHAKSKYGETLQILELYKMAEGIQKAGGSFMDAATRKDWAGAGAKAGSLVGEIAKTMAGRVVKGDFKGAGQDYLATQKYVGRIMLATDAINTGVARNIKAFMEQRYLALTDPRLADRENLPESEVRKIEAEIAKKLAHEDTAELEDTRKVAFETAQAESDQGHFGAVGTREHALTKARRVEQLIEEATYGKETLQKADNFAAEATFNGDSYGIVGQIMNGVFGSDMRNRIGAGGALLTPINPFPRTASNLINQAVNYSPYGFLRAHGKNMGTNWFLKEDNKYRKEAPEYGSVEFHALQAKATAGTIALGVLGGLVGLAIKAAWEDKEGKNPFWFAIHGNGPKDPVLRRQWLASGNKPYSVRIGKATMKYNDIPAFNLVMGAMGILHDQIVWGHKEFDQKGVTSLISSALLSVVGTTMNRSMLGGMSGLFDIISANTTEAARQTALNRLVASYATGFTNPGVFRSLEQLISGDLHETSTWEGWALQFVPMGQTIAGNPKYNILGEPITKGLYETLFERVAPVIPTKHPILTPLTQAALKLTPPSRFGVVENGGTKIREMTDAEFYRFAKIYGDALTQRFPEARVNGLVSQAGVNPQVAQDEINRICTDARNQAQGRLMQESRLRRATASDKKFQSMIQP